MDIHEMQALEQSEKLTIVRYSSPYQYDLIFGQLNGNDHPREIMVQRAIEFADGYLVRLNTRDNRNWYPLDAGTFR